MSIVVSVRATKFDPDNYGEPQSGQLANGYSWEGRNYNGQIISFNEKESYKILFK